MLGEPNITFAKSGVATFFELSIAPASSSEERRAHGVL